MNVLERLTAGLDEIARHGIGASEETAGAQDIQFRHRRNLAEPLLTPKNSPLVRNEPRCALPQDCRRNRKLEPCPENWTP